MHYSGRYPPNQPCTHINTYTHSTHTHLYLRTYIHIHKYPHTCTILVGIRPISLVRQQDGAAWMGTFLYIHTSTYRHDICRFSVNYYFHAHFFHTWNIILVPDVYEKHHSNTWWLFIHICMYVYTYMHIHIYTYMDHCSLIPTHSIMCFDK